ncbi:MAG: SMC-Scp complex subunit ScpB [Sporolactobacillus sp.]
MTAAKKRSIIEGLLYLNGEEGLQISQIEKMFPDCSSKEIHHIIEHMKKDYIENPSCALMISDIPFGWRLTTKPELAPYIEKFATIPKATPLSQAALETVAIIAYKQPVSRMTIDEIRGVKSERALHTLLLKGLIKEVGRAEGAGRAILYGVTSAFLDYFGLHSIEEMPPLLKAVSQPNEQLDAYDLFYDQYKETLDNLGTAKEQAAEYAPE